MTRTLTGREYLRVSQDASGRARSITEQNDDNLHSAERHGFTINGEAYSDVAISASRYARKIRGDFARLLADLEGGRFGADVLVLWESSRGSRQVGEWDRLIKLCEARGVLIHVTTHARTYDPRRARHRRTLLEDAIDAAYMSDKASDAIVRAAKANAKAGLPHGRVAFGFKRVYEVTANGRRVLVGQVPHEKEAPVVVELFDRLHKGESLRSIARVFRERGVVNRSGKPFSPEHLRDVALRACYGGYRVRTPVKPGEDDPAPAPGSLDGAVKAVWEPLVDLQVFNDVRARLQSPQRKTHRPGRAVHWLSRIALCDVCGGLLYATSRRSRREDGSPIREYECSERSCVRIPADDLDAYAEALVFDHLSQDDVIADLRSATENDAGELAKVRSDLAAARADLQALRNAGRERKIDLQTLLDVEPGYVARVKELEQHEQDLMTPPALAGLIGPAEQVIEEWDRKGIPARREIARLLFAPDAIGELRVTRPPGCGPRADLSRVVRRTEHGTMR